MTDELQLTKQSREEKEQDVKRVILVISSLLILGAFIFAGHRGNAVAQDTDRPLLQISEIDITQFPIVNLFIYGENLNTNLASVNLQVEEDRSAQTILQDRFMDVGIQTALVVDTSQSILSPGNSGTPRYTEATNAIRRLVVDRGILSAETDWLSVQTVGAGTTAFQVLADWNRDHNAIVNALTQSQPTGLSANTSLFGLIKFALDQFEDTEIPANRQKFIVVFSDGLDIVSALDLENIATRASRNNIRLHTVLLGPEGRDARDNLQRLATLTGGQYVLLRTPEDVDAIWDLIGQARGQRVLSYRTSRPQPAEVNVIATLPSSRQLNRTGTFPVTGVQPPVIKITQPADGVPVERQAGSPQDLAITLEVTWPDNHPRALRRVEYEFNNQLILREAEPFLQVTVPIGALSDGMYTLRVRAVDELGLTSDDRPMSVAIQPPQAQPPAAISGTAPLTGAVPLTGGVVPTAGGAISGVAPISQGGVITGPGAVTTVASLSSTVAVSETTGIFGGFGIAVSGWLRNRLGVNIQPTTVWLLLIFPLVLIALSLIYVGRRRRLPARVQGAPGSFETPDFTEPARNFDVDDATEPARLPDFATVAPAYLVYQEGGDHLPKKLPIDAGREIRIGRKREYSDLVLDDKRVSRLHAVISEKSDGFYIRDEGSAGGTLVNRRQLGINATGRLLKHGDIVNFNTIAYRFEMADQQKETPKAVISDDEATEPFVGPPSQE